MPGSPNAHILLNVRDRTAGQYNNANFNANNQNIIQGQIHSVSVAEVNFPYDIPNIQAGYNFFGMLNVGPPNYALVVTVAPGFYTGTELATAINVASTAAGAANVPVIVAGDIPQCTFNIVSNRFTFTSPPAPSAPRFGVWNFTSPSTFPAQQNLVSQLYKDILSIMGYYTEQNPAVAPGAFSTFVSGSAPLTFTQYIDICSPQLCKFQYFRDGSTTNLARRSDVVCRLFVENNVSLPIPVEGTSPFAILRQFYNARVMRWTSDNSIGTIDIQLYDDTGQPLQITWVPRPYQITFNVFELDKEER